MAVKSFIVHDPDVPVSPYSQCPLVFSGVPCVSPGAPWCSLMSPLVSPLVSPGVPWCPLVSPGVPWCPLVFPGVHRWPQDVPLSPSVPWPNLSDGSQLSMQVPWTLLSKPVAETLTLWQHSETGLPSRHSIRNESSRVSLRLKAPLIPTGHFGAKCYKTFYVRNLTIFVIS